MTVINKKTHYLLNDFRIESLNQIITAVDISISNLKKKTEVVSWYDSLWLLEETEPLFGLAFISFQNYINGSIKDFSENTVNKKKYYQIEPKFKNFEKSSIELIIGLANYSKHKDEFELHKGTRDIFECFRLNLDNDLAIDKSPFFEGLTILNDKWDLIEILKIVTHWRKKLWTTEV